MIPTLVVLDGAGCPVGPAITWEDARAEVEGARLSEAVGARRLYELTGQRVDGRYLLPMVSRVMATSPDNLTDGAFFAGAKDYLFQFLSGDLATDPSTATGYGCFGLDSGDWLGDIVDAMGLAGETPRLPPVEPSLMWRPLCPAAALALGLPSGLPVCLGAADSVLGALGCGARNDGDIAYLSGTSTVIIGVSTQPLRDPAGRWLVTPLADAAWGLEMDLLSTGSAVAWLAATLGLAAEEDVLGLALGVDHAQAPIFLPYLAPGEQGALWDADLSGAIIGLDLGHGPAHLARALLNGIVVESRRCLAALDTVLPSGDVHLAGRGVVTEPWRSDIADASGRSVRFDGHRAGDHSALGAALVAAQSVDGLSLLPVPTEPGWVAQPAPGRKTVWELLAASHDAVLTKLQPVHGQPAGPGAAFDSATDVEGPNEPTTK
jgi:sugar (pentulose or hexulose) kinase